MRLITQKQNTSSTSTSRQQHLPSPFRTAWQLYISLQLYTQIHYTQKSCLDVFFTRRRKATPSLLLSTDEISRGCRDSPFSRSCFYDRGTCAREEVADTSAWAGDRFVTRLHGSEIRVFCRMLGIYLVVVRARMTADAAASRTFRSTFRFRHRRCGIEKKELCRFSR